MSADKSTKPVGKAPVKTSAARTGNSTAKSASKSASKPAAKSTKKSTTKSPRRRAREFALQGLYAYLLNKDDQGVIEAQIRGMEGFEKADVAMFSTLLGGVMGHQTALEQVIGTKLDRPLTELSPIERAVLLLATYELTHHIEVPYRVVINEAIELAKSFGGTDGHRYVNGVLDQLASQLRTHETAA